MRSHAWKVVVIDDSPEDRAEVRRLLLNGSDRRYHFTEAETGATGIRAVLDASPDCVVLDYNLPDMDALQVLAALVGPDGATTCPVVVLTGSANSEFSRAVLRAGAQDFIGKGWMTAESLTRVVENAAERWAMVRELQARTAEMHATELQLKQVLVEIGNERELLSTTLDSIGDGLITTDVNGRVTNLNRVAELLTGWTTLEAQGQPLTTVFQIINESTRQPVLNPVFKALEEGVIVGLANHTLLIHKDGTERPIDDSAAPIRGADLVTRGCVLVFRDITERKMAEEQLRASEGRVRQVVDSMFAFVGMIAPDGTLTEANKAPLAAAGLTRSDVLGKPFWDCYWWSHDPAVQDRLRAAFERAGRGEVVRYDETIRVANDARVVIDLMLQPVFEAGRLLFVIPSAVDITDRMRAEEQLRVSEEFNRSLMDGSADCVKVLDLEGRLLLMNEPGLCALEIDDFARFCGQLWPKLWPADMEAEIQRAVAAARVGNAYSFQAFCPTAKGTPRWWDVTVSAVRNPVNGPVVRLLAVSRDITDRKLAEQTIARQVSELDTLYATTPAGLFQFDADLRFVRVNAWTAAMNGPSVEAHIGSTAGEVMDAEVARAVERFLRQVMETGEALLGIEVHGTSAANGEERDWLASYYPLRSANNEVIGVHGVVLDITERKQVEARLVAHERELRTLADNTPDILTRFDRDLRHVFVNAAVERATGRNRDEFLGKTNRELGMPADLCDLWEAAIRHVFHHRQHKSIDFSFDTPDGPRHYVARLVPEVGPDGAVESVLGVTADITDARKAEAAVRVSEERLARAQRAARVGTWDWDLVSGRASWTPEAWLLFGRSSAADGPVTYDLWRSSLHPDDRDRAADAAAAARIAGPYRDEYRVRYPDGREAWLESEGEVVRDNTGAAVRMIGTVRDISDHKLSDEALRVADQRKDEFLATLAHELRNPLAPIRNGVAILSVASSPDVVEKVVAMMDRQLGHMVNLVDDLLDVSRVRTGKITLRAERVTVQEVVDAAVEACGSIISQKSHTLEVDLTAEPLAVTGDETRLMQVVANLLTNAAKYSEPGGRVRVTAGRDGDEAVIRVSDTGMGIAADLLPTLWDLFTQVRDTLDKAQGGLGIGLSLVKQLVEMHGGTVAAQSAGVGHGSTFTVRLPLAVSADQTAVP